MCLRMGFWPENGRLVRSMVQLDRGLKILRMRAGTVPRVVELLEPKWYKTENERNGHFGLQRAKTEKEKKISGNQGTFLPRFKSELERE